MKDKDFISKISDNKKEISTILEIDSLKKENQEMLSFLKKIFKSDINTDDNNDKIKELKQKNKLLQNELNNLKEDLTKKENQTTQLSQQNISLNDNISQLQKEQQNDINIQLNTIYNTLDESTKSGIKNILKSKQKTSILISGILNIDSLWHYTAHLRNEHKDTEFEKLKSMINILMAQYKGVENITLQDVNINDKFDSEIHTRDNRSENMDGNITQVILQGYSINDEIVKKSIVQIS